MNSNTFGNIDKFKMLEYLTEQIEYLSDSNKKNYISTFITEFNTRINRMEANWVTSIDDIKFQEYLLSLIKKDYCDRIDSLKDRYTQKLLSYLKNYIYAKINNTLDYIKRNLPEEIEKRLSKEILTMCQAGMDGECNHPNCPQNRDDEPHKSGRSCPLPHWSDDEEY